MRLDFLRRFLAMIVPRERATVYNFNAIPDSLARHVDADRIADILRATERGQSDDYLALVRDVLTGDANLLADFMQRKTRLLSKPWKVLSEDQTDARAARNDKFCRAMLKGVDGLMPALAHLLDSALYPVAVVEKIFAPGNEPGLNYRLAKLAPVPHHMLDFRDGELWIKEVNERGDKTGGARRLDPMRYIAHRGHLLQGLPDCWGGPARAVLFWWFFANSARMWWAQGLERHAVPFMVGKYDSNRPEDKWALMDAFKASARLFGLVISQGTDVQVFKDMASGDAAAFEKLISFAQAQMSRLVVGQTMTGKAANTGLGSSQATVQDDVLTDIVQFDAMLLGATLSEQLLKPLMELNGLDGPVPEITWQITQDDAKAQAEVLKVLKDAGIRLKDEGMAQLSEAVGFPLERAPEGAPEAAPAIPAPVGRTLLSATAKPLTAQEANDAVALAAAADLSQAFRGSLAPVRRLIRESESPEDLVARLTEFYADYAPGRLAAIISEALTAYAGNSTVKFPR